jgi:hypothetical protein
LAEVEFERGRAETLASRTEIAITAKRDEPQGRLLLTGANIIPMTDRAAPGAILERTPTF